MGFFMSTKGSIISDAFKLTEDHANLKEGIMHDVALYDDHLTIKSVVGKNEANLKYSQITDVFYGAQKDIILVKKEKSVIGRAMVGGLLFKSTGAIVGAISGTTGPKVKSKTKISLVFVISYKSSSGEDSYIQFEDTRMYKGKAVARKLCELCGIDDFTDKASKDGTSVDL